MIEPSQDNGGLLLGLAVALASGMLIGIEREQRRSDAQSRIPAGVRTFTLIALSGAISTLLGTVLIAVGAGFIALAALLSYRSSSATDPGLTTEVAMFVAFLLGVLAMSQPMLAAGLGVGVALILASKSRLHEFTRRVLTAQELHDALLLIASALIVLPLLPDRAIDPWQVINPHRLWRLVVLMMAINALGYIAQRALGTRLGLPLSGFASGFASATATIGAMGSRAKTHPDQRPACVAASTLANVATIIQLALVLATLAPALLRALTWPLIASGTAAALFAAFSGIAAWKDRESEPTTLRGRPFQPKHALVFAALIGVILIVSALFRQWFGEYGLLAATAAGGFADAHAPAASIAQVFVTEKISLQVACIGVLIGLATNTISKTIVAFVSGGAAFAWRLLPGLVAMLAAFGAALFIFP